MKKDILFVLNSLNIGGAEKSLVTILNMFDYDKYNVDLFLFGVEGELLDQIPNKVNILSQDDDYKYFVKNRKTAFIYFFRKGKIRKGFFSFLYNLGYLFYKFFKRNDVYIGWTFKKNILDKIEKKYDVSIGFMERSALYFSVCNVKSDNKIGFIHNDYSKYKFNYKLDNKYFKSLSKVVTVSNECKKVLCEIFPQYSNKFIVIKNMIDYKYIEKKASEVPDFSIVKCFNIKDNCVFDNNYINIVTVARLVEQKGIDNAVKICNTVKEKVSNVRWFVIGEGSEKSKLENLVKQYKLENSFFLIGKQANPYYWINNCDIYVQPSRYEGYGITVAEALCLKKFIIASNIKVFEELIDNDITGILANDNEDFANKILEHIKSESHKNKILNNLQNYNINKHDEIKKFYEIL